MDKIQRLLLKAIEESQRKGVSAAFIDKENGKYIATLHLWDGKFGSFNPETDRLQKVCDTEEEAYDYIEETAKEYRKMYKGDLVVLYDDIEAMEDIPVISVKYVTDTKEATELLLKSMKTEELKELLELADHTTDAEFEAYIEKMVNKYSEDMKCLHIKNMGEFVQNLKEETAKGGEDAEV